MKLNKSGQEFLKVFSKSQEWFSLKQFIEELIHDVESVNGDFKFKEKYTAGERYAGREMASEFGIKFIQLVERYNKLEAQKKKPEDSME